MAKLSTGHVPTITCCHLDLSLEELPSKLKGLVRNVKKVEAEIAALKISYLKKINKSTSLVILDS